MVNSPPFGASTDETISIDYDHCKVTLTSSNFNGAVYPTLSVDALFVALGIGKQDRVLVVGTYPWNSLPPGCTAIERIDDTLAFADGAFDVSISLGGIEASPNPSLWCSELQRVSLRGLIEAPSEMAVIATPSPDHRWLISQVDGMLTFRPRPFVRAPFRHFVRHAMRKDTVLRRRWLLDYRNVSNVQFEWNGSFDTSQIAPDDASYSPDKPELLAEACADSVINDIRFGAAFSRTLLAEAQRSVESSPNTALYHNVLGCVQWMGGRKADARRSFESARLLEPSNAAYTANAVCADHGSPEVVTLPPEPEDVADIQENWAGKVYYAFVGYDDRLAEDIGILPDDRVLDVGGGQRPLRRADVSVDFDVFEGVHRQGQAISREKPLVCGDVHHLPFADKSFDVVCCRMVLEHVDDPAAAVSELQRVGKRVFLEVPNALWECFYGHPCHRWTISHSNNTLTFKRKPFRDIPFRSAVVPYLYSQRDIQRRFEVTLRNVSVIQLVADGSLQVEVRDDPDCQYDFNRVEDAVDACCCYGETLISIGLPGVAVAELDDAMRMDPSSTRARDLRLQAARLLGDRAAIDRLTSNPVSASARVPEAFAVASVLPRQTEPPTHSWSAPLFDPTGYAEEARSFLLALEDAGMRIAASEIRWNDRDAVLDRDVEHRLRQMTSRAPTAGTVHVSHILAPHFTRRENACLNVGRTMFETDRLPENWVDACNRMDEVWVPSEFNRESFTFAGVDSRKLRVVPGAIDVDAYDLATPALRIEGSRRFNFLSVFDWTLRKGWDVLVKAFVEEFEQGEDVALIIKTHSSVGYTMQQIVGQVSDYLVITLGKDPENVPDIIFQDAVVPAHRMPALYAAADCFVLPTRGEGWGRPYMEAMAMGLPTIGTNWSGNTAFMTPYNSYLLDCDVVEVPEQAWRETPTFQGHKWAEPNCAHLRRLMRIAFAEPAQALRVGAAGRLWLEEHFTYRRVSDAIVDIFDPVKAAA